MKEKIQKIVQNQKGELIICMLAIFLSVMCFVSSNTSKPAESGQPGSELAADEADYAQPEENSDTQEAFSYETDDSKAAAENTGREEQNVAPALDEAVGQAVLSYYENQYMDLECPAEGHEILGCEEQDGYVMVYALTMYCEYGFSDDCLVKGAGIGVMPAVIKFSYDEGGGYVLEDYQISEDENNRMQWVQSMFPGALWETCNTVSEESAAALEKQGLAYAENYLHKIGREAAVRKDPVSERQVLTDAGVSVEVSNKLCEMDSQLENYPYWLGNQEKLEDGVRYVYELALSKESEEIVYTKTKYDTDEIVEQFRFDMHTGEEITG